MRLTLFLFLLFSVTACSFNGVFLHPEFDPGSESITYTATENKEIEFTADTVSLNTKIKQS